MDSTSRFKIINQDTLVPLSTLLVLCSLMFFMANVYGLASDTERRVQDLEKQRDRLFKIEGDLGIIKGKLDLLIELESKKRDL